jgi:hypothetical protein
MKVSVCAKVVYQYQIEIPDEGDIEIWADTLDPVYPRIVTAMIDSGLDYEGSIVSIVDNDTDEVYYLGD